MTGVAHRTRLAVLALVSAVLGGLLMVTAAGPAHAEPAAARDGAEDIATCLQSARSLSALFLYDQSGSLTTSDPDGVRYDGLRVALESLSRVNRADGAPVAVEIAVSSFDDSYYRARDVVGWTRLNDGTSDDIAKSIDGIVARAKDRTAPVGGTNFTEAMTGAREDLKDRGGRGTCRAVFWFTDGEDGVTTVGGEPCRPDSGLIDEMRKAGIVVVGLQLGPQTDDLKAIATGDSGAVQCGRHPIPVDWAGGVYIQADDSAALRRLFGSLGNIVRGCTPQGDRRGNVDPGIRSMNVTIRTPAQVNTVRLDAPDGTVITAATTGSTTEGGYRTLAQSDSSYVSITVDFPAGHGAGEWLVSAGQAIPPADMEFCVYSGLHLARVDPDASPIAGGTADIVYHAVDTQGQEADLSDYADVAPGAAAVAANGDIRKATAERDANRIIVKVDSQPIDARLQVQVSAQLTTVSGLALTPLAADEGVGFTLSKAFPTVTPIDQLDLGSAMKKNPTSAMLTLSGSPLGPSKVCFDQPVNFVAPDGQSGSSLNAPASCVELAQGESRELPVSVTPVEATVGSGEAELPIRLVPVAGSEMDGREAPVILPVVWRYEDPKNAAVLWGIVAAASLVSVVLPLLVLGLAGWVTARFDVRGMRYEVIPVTVGPEGAQRVNPLRGSPGTILQLDQLRHIAVSDRRRFKVGPVEFFSTSSVNPFRAPAFSVKATAPGHRVISTVPPPRDDGATAAAPPGLGFVVVAVVSEADLRNPRIVNVPAELVVVMRDNGVASSRLDGLMNSKLQWSVVADQWRRGVDIDPSESGSSDRSPGYGHLDSGGPGSPGGPRGPGGPAGPGGSTSHLDKYDA